MKKTEVPPELVMAMMYIFSFIFISLACFTFCIGVIFHNVICIIYSTIVIPLGVATLFKAQKIKKDLRLPNYRKKKDW